jgi:hypothetical protein
MDIASPYVSYTLLIVFQSIHIVIQNIQYVKLILHTFLAFIQPKEKLWVGKQVAPIHRIHKTTAAPGSRVKQ